MTLAECWQGAWLVSSRAFDLSHAGDGRCNLRLSVCDGSFADLFNHPSPSALRQQSDGGCVPQYAARAQRLHSMGVEPGAVSAAANRWSGRRGPHGARTPESHRRGGRRGVEPVSGACASRPL